MGRPLMRRGVTVLVVVVVAAIALAAGIDALRGEDPAPAAETVSTSTTSERPTSSVPLEDGPGGTLYYTDSSCELHAIELPGSTPAEAPGWDECRFVLSPTGRRVSGAGSGWDPRSDPLIGRLFQSEDGMIQVSTNLGPEGEPFRGTAPAWRPDGTLTYFAEGAYREWPDGGVIISERELVGAISRDWDVAELRRGRSRIRDAVWLDDSRLAVILVTDTRSLREEVFALIEGERLVEALPSEGIRFGRLWASPRGGFLALQTESLALIDRAGRPLSVPPIGGIRSIAFSPDERWAAAASSRFIYIFRPGSQEWTTRISLIANDLAWRGEAGPPALADADEAREWLGGVGATGRLFLTQAEGPDCTLHTLLLPDLEWAQQPSGLPNPCRFTLDYRGAVVTEDTVPRPSGGDWAQCHQGVLDWFSDSGLVARYPGACAPAWTPDSRLTFVRDGSLHLAWPNGDSQRLLSRQEVSKMFGRTAALEEVAWVDDERFWAVVRSGESAIVALMTTDRLVSTPSFTTRTIEGLRVSASGMVAARTDEGIVFFDTGGRRALTFGNGQAVSWAPGEQIAAVATPSEVLFVAPLSGEIVTLPLAVRDLEWVVP